MILVPFAAFACCMLGQFWLIREVRRALASGHPETWRALSENAFFLDNAVIAFVLRRRDLELDDSDLRRITRRLRILQVVAIEIWLIYAAMLMTRVGFQKL
jgi:hypothetical protein